MGDKFFVR